MMDRFPCIDQIRKTAFQSENEPFFRHIGENRLPLFLFLGKYPYMHYPMFLFAILRFSFNIIQNLNKL